jgi:ribosome biogenesis GTPase / thiamine phosphate phosphatase
MQREGTVLSNVGGRYQISSSGEELEASLRGRFKQESQTQVLVGDRVMVDVQPDGSATIESVLPRTNVLERRMPGRRRGVRRIAANVDQVIVVGAADRPAWDSHLVDRFVVVAEVNGLPAVVVVNKVDLVDDPSVLGAPYEAAGYRVLYTSAKNGMGIPALRDALRGHVSLLSGTTGVGKSSLLNAVDPGLDLRTGAVSRKAGAGRHTTVSAAMHPLEGGGYVVDTPGLRDVGLWAVDPSEVAQAFPDFAAYAAQCRFDDCRHRGEPDCGVVAAVERGDVDAGRLGSYRQLLEEAEEEAVRY